MIDALQQDFVVFAEAKGLNPRRVLLAHALRNALIPVVTVAALETGYLLGGNTIVETVFGWPGLALVTAATLPIAALAITPITPLADAAAIPQPTPRDAPYPGVLTLAVIYVCVNFAADIVYMILNPRVKL